MAWGTGTAIAHRAVDSIMGPRVIQHETVASPATAAAPIPSTNSFEGHNGCGDQSKALQDVRFSSQYIRTLSSLYFSFLNCSASLAVCLIIFFWLYVWDLELVFRLLGIAIFISFPHLSSFTLLRH